MKISVLDAATLGDDLKEEILKTFGKFGEVQVRAATAPDEVGTSIEDSDVLIVNKIRLNRSNLPAAKKLKLICVAATGYDNIDTEYCGKNNIAVCNVVGYSTHSVAQITVAMVLNLANHIPEYNEFVSSGEYTESGIANRLTPVYHELCGKTWGVVGAGNIGGQVAKIADALGCRVIVNKRTPDKNYECVDIDTLCRNSDIITIHTPLTDLTRNLINRDRIAMMKEDAILVNVARGAVCDETALADAILAGKLGGLGIDVYSEEPFKKEHPFTKIMKCKNVCLLPHMAWGAYEARLRCVKTMGSNIESFLNGEKQNRVV